MYICTGPNNPIRSWLVNVVVRSSHLSHLRNPIVYMSIGTFGLKFMGICFVVISTYEIQYLFCQFLIYDRNRNIFLTSASKINTRVRPKGKLIASTFRVVPDEALINSLSRCCLFHFQPHTLYIEEKTN